VGVGNLVGDVRGREMEIAKRCFLAGLAGTAS